MVAFLHNGLSFVLPIATRLSSNAIMLWCKLLPCCHFPFSLNVVWWNICFSPRLLRQWFELVFFFPTPAWAMKFWTSLSIKSKKIQRETARRRTEALRGIQIKAARPRFKNNQAGRPATNSFITLVMKAGGARMLSQFEVTVSKLAVTFHRIYVPCSGTTLL